MGLPIIVSFYTKDWQYPEYANKLKNDCIRLKIDYDIQELPSTGDYIRNTSLKPQFILDMLNKHKRPVLWIDCDGSLLKSPDVLIDFDKSDFDFSAKKCPDNYVRQYHVGTLCFNYNRYVINLIETWIDCSFNKQRADDSAFDVAIREFDTPPKVKLLPDNYFIILKKLTDVPPNRAVIVHRLSQSPSKIKRNRNEKRKV